MTTEREQLAEMEDTQLVSYWNVLQMGQRMMQNTEAKETGERHIPIVSSLLTERGIPHEDGKRIEMVKVDRETGRVIQPTKVAA